PRLILAHTSRARMRTALRALRAVARRALACVLRSRSGGSQAKDWPSIYIVVHATSASEGPASRPASRLGKYAGVISNRRSRVRDLSQIFASWNQLKGWLSAVDGLRRAAWEPQSLRQRVPERVVMGPSIS